MRLNYYAQALGELPAPADPSVVTEIDARFNHLRILPAFILNCRHLRVLRLSYNEIGELPEAFAELSELRELYLSANPLQRFPSTLLRLPKLEVLHLDKAAIEEIPDEFQPSDLVELNLSFNRLQRIPERLFSRATRLRSLGLARNRLLSLPDSLAALSALEVLDLSYNGNEPKRPQRKLKPADDTDIPERRPSELSFGSEDYEPEEFTDEPGHPSDVPTLRPAPKVTEPAGTSAGPQCLTPTLPGLPENFGQLHRLQRLSLQGNGLVSLPNSFGQLASLRVLTLHENTLTALPESFGGLAALERLDASKNHLKSLPPSIGACRALAWLVLGENRLTSLPAEFLQLSSLTHCSLRDNPLTSLPSPKDGDTTEYLPALGWFDLSGNALPKGWVAPSVYPEPRIDKPLKRSG